MKSRYDQYRQPYGDLALLNKSKRILDAVGKKQLEEIVSDYLDLLNTSAAVYEADGSYAVGIFTSGWCRMMDGQSREICNTDDDAEALASGQWHCHESCWDASRRSIETDAPTEAETDGKRGCRGGIFIYAVPIHAFGEAIGSINFGYGSPPADVTSLTQLANLYGLPVKQVSETQMSNNVASERDVELAKIRLQTAANMIGALVERYESRGPDMNLEKIRKIIDRLG